MILKTSAEKGALSSGSRSCSAPCPHRADDGRDVQRRGEVIHHRVQEVLDPLVLEGGAAKDG